VTAYFPNPKEEPMPEPAPVVTQDDIAGLLAVLLTACGSPLAPVACPPGSSFPLLDAQGQPTYIASVRVC
jgi:hypothetical protein